MVQLNQPSDSFDVIIAGAGPAGTSAAIHVAMNGGKVLLVEAKKFPRAKLCGEFISPECVDHFQRLGVNDEMFSAGGAAITRTVFYARRGQNVEVPSEWFNSGGSALGLSRAEMDHKLLARARSAGVTVLEETQASGLIHDSGKVNGLKARQGNSVFEYRAPITIDATGRTRALGRHVDKMLSTQTKQSKRALVAFKTHVRNARLAEGACEIYCYPRGYGGLNSVEGGVSNLCFIVAAEDVRTHASNPEQVMREVLMKNSRAATTLAEASSCTPWLSVSLEGFGRRVPAPAPGLLTIGDAASFIDPFTGSGMLMALESGDVVSEIINRHLPSLRRGEDPSLLAQEYEHEYSKRFHSRLGVAALLRRAAFVPGLPEAVILCCGTSARLRRRIARSTRPSANHKIDTRVS
ncbi:MAG TPA: NAD(P)/FAD-dependent oxidoreductase [Pyrinomonadaceae bacterium]|nr:NAD(P)/FAD-dependent oxidoreductase [Pyrinomonadaceae bacterium]